MSGTLYLVATPIGNLEDITLRALRVLREASVVACEDTRRTRAMLAHFDVHTPILSLHEHNEAARIPQILGLLREGKSVAVVSDAGTPAVSDPGAALVAAAARAGLRIVPVPGASAVTAAIGLADFPAERFAFVGFPPRRRAERLRFLKALVPLPLALVLFEAPHRVRETLADIATAFEDRRILLARELTKVHEEILRGTAVEVAAALSADARGEVTLVLAGHPEERAARRSKRPSPGTALPAEEFLRRMLAEGLSRRDAARALAAAYGLPARQAYRMATEE